MLKKECPEQDSNLHASRHTHLKRARLPIPPPGHFSKGTNFLTSLCFKMWSGKRDSDPRPQPWQGCALPTELFPHYQSLVGASLSNADAKVRLFSKPPKLFPIFFLKKCKSPQKRVNPYDFGSPHSRISAILRVFRQHAACLRRDG